MKCKFTPDFSIKSAYLKSAFLPKLFYFLWSLPGFHLFLTNWLYWFFYLSSQELHPVTHWMDSPQRPKLCLPYHTPPSSPVCHNLWRATPNVTGWAFCEKTVFTWTRIFKHMFKTTFTTGQNLKEKWNEWRKVFKAHTKNDFSQILLIL